MVRTILVVLSLAVFSDGYAQGNTTYAFNWAVANKRLLENEVLRVVKEKYPYPDETASDQTGLRMKRSQISSQIRSTRLHLKEQCKSEKARMEKESHEVAHTEMKDGSSAPVRYQLKLASSHYYDCVAKIGDDPSMRELEAQKESLDAMYRKKADHDKKVHDLSKMYMNKLIAEYSKSKLEIVIDGGRDHIIYNASGIVVDITDVLISRIDKKQIGPLPTD